MKRVTALVLLIVSTLGIITGCGSGKSNSELQLPQIEYKDFDFKVNPETFQVQVKVDGIVEELSEPLNKSKVSNLKDDGSKVSWDYEEEAIEVDIEKKDKYLDVSIKSTSSEENTFEWPRVSGEAYMLPLNEGKYIESDDELWKEYFEGSELKTLENLSMQFFAVDKQEYSLLFIMENPYNNHLIFDTEEEIKFKLQHQYPQINDHKEYGFRVYITEKDPVEVAKIYKSYVMETGEFKTLADKAKDNKNIEKLYGAPHVYLWDKAVIAEENIKWQELATAMPKELKLWIQELLNTKVEDGGEQATAFDEISNQEWVDKYTKNSIIKGFSAVLQLKDFYNEDIFKNLDKESEAFIEKGVEKCNQVEVIELNKRLLKSVLGDAVDPIEKWADANTVDVIKDMKNSGIDNMWVGLEDWNIGYIKPELVEEINNTGYLIGTYDSYHSIHKEGEEQWITAKFEDTSLYENATVTNKNGDKIEGFQGQGRKLNPTLAMPSVKKRVSDIMATGLPFNSWFLDTDSTGEVYDDYSPKHITTEKQDIEARIERMKYLKEEWNMVVGAEGGNDFANSAIAFAHGIETPYFTWMDKDMKSNKESEYYMGRYYSSTGGVPEMFAKEVPLKDKFRKLFLDPSYTIPLYKLVYNDSVITTHWWGYGTLKFKDDVESRMLYEVLYNVPPLYHIDKNQWAKDKETIVNHTRVWSNFSRKVINEEMTAFEILSEDEMVQMTQYGDDIRVIANFSHNEVNIEGNRIKGKSLIIIEGDKKIEYTP